MSLLEEFKKGIKEGQSITDGTEQGDRWKATKIIIQNTIDKSMSRIKFKPKQGTVSKEMEK